MPNTNDQDTSGANGSTNRAKATRSRAGCMVCRSRRVKCDQGKPECQRCVNYGAECVYPEKKRFDPVAVADKLHRRHKPTNNTSEDLHSILSYEPSPSSTSMTIPPYRPPPHSLGPLADLPNHGSPLVPVSAPSGLMMGGASVHGGGTQPTTPASAPVRQMDPLDLLMALCRDTRMGQFFSGPVDPPDFLREAFPVEDDLRCFHHCFTYTLSIMVVYEEQNPWVDLVVPLFLFNTGSALRSISALRLATLATGAVHLSSLEEKGTRTIGANGRYRDLGLGYRDEAIKLLRIAQHIPEEFQSDEFLAATMMVSCADILGANQRWRENLRLAHAAVRYRGGCERILFGDAMNPLAPTPLRVCLIEHLVMMDFCATFSTGQPLAVITAESEWWERLAEPDPNILDSFEGFSGTHRGLIPFMVRTEDLLFESRNTAKYITIPSPESNPFYRPDLPGRTRQLMHDLQMWREMVVPTMMNKRTADGTMAQWHVTILVILRDLMGRSRRDEEVQRHALATLSICEQIGVKVEYMNWPLLFACSVLIDPDHRQRAREVFRSYIYQCSYEIDITGSVAEECWRRIDQGMDDYSCSWREILPEMGCAVLLG